MVTQGCIQEQAHKPQDVFAVEETLCAVGHRRQLWVRGSSSAPRAAQDGMAWCGTVLPALALPFHRPDLLLLHRSATLLTLPAAYS